MPAGEGRARSATLASATAIISSISLESASLRIKEKDESHSTAYLKSKWEAEVDLRKRAESDYAELQKRVIQLLLTGDQEAYREALKKELEEQARERERLREKRQEIEEAKEKAKEVRRKEKADAEVKLRAAAEQRENQRAIAQAKQTDQIVDLLNHIGKRLDVLEDRVSTIISDEKEKQKDAAQFDKRLEKLVERIELVEKKRAVAAAAASASGSPGGSGVSAGLSNSSSAVVRPVSPSASSPSSPSPLAKGGSARDRAGTEIKSPPQLTTKVSSLVENFERGGGSEKRKKRKEQHNSVATSKPSKVKDRTKRASWTRPLRSPKLKDKEREKEKDKRGGGVDEDDEEEEEGNGANHNHSDKPRLKKHLSDVSEDQKNEWRGSVDLFESMGKGAEKMFQQAADTLIAEREEPSIDPATGEPREGSFFYG